MASTPPPTPPAREFKIRNDFFQWHTRSLPIRDRIVAMLYEYAERGLIPEEIAHELDVPLNEVYDAGQALRQWNYIEQVTTDYLTNLVAAQPKPVRWKLTYTSWLFCQNMKMVLELEHLKDELTELRAICARPGNNTPEIAPHVAVAAIARFCGKAVITSRKQYERHLSVPAFFEEEVDPDDRLTRKKEGTRIHYVYSRADKTAAAHTA